MRLACRLALVAAVAATSLAPPAGAAPAERRGPIVLPAPTTFAAAVASLEKATGARASELELNGKILLAAEGRAFEVDGPTATRVLDGSHEPFFRAGLYLFRHERSFGLGGGRDTLALVATTDREALIRRVGTTDPAKKVTTEQIVAWLAALEKEEPFVLDEIGHDFVAGHFRVAPKDPAAVARRCAEFSPELVKGSASGLQLLTEEIRANRTLYLIW